MSAALINDKWESKLYNVPICSMNLMDFPPSSEKMSWKNINNLSAHSELSLSSFEFISNFSTFLIHFSSSCISTPVKVHQLNSSTSKIIDFTLESTSLNGRRKIGEFINADKSSPDEADKSSESDEPSSNCNKNAVYMRINESALRVQWNWTMREQIIPSNDVAVEAVNFRWVIKFAMLPTSQH